MPSQRIEGVCDEPEPELERPVSSYTKDLNIHIIQAMQEQRTHIERMVILETRFEFTKQCIKSYYKDLGFECEWFIRSSNSFTFSAVNISWTAEQKFIMF